MRRSRWFLRAQVEPGARFRGGQPAGEQGADGGKRKHKHKQKNKAFGLALPGAHALTRKKKNAYEA